MIGDLLSAIGLILSAHGTISTIRSSGRLDEIDERLRRSEGQLRELGEGVEFIRTNLRIVAELTQLLAARDKCVLLEVKHAASPERVADLAKHPNHYRTTPFMPWNLFARDLPSASELDDYLIDNVLVFLVDQSPDFRVATVARDFLEEQDIFDARPITTFDPAQVVTVTSFLTDIELCRQPGDFFQVQFEEES